MVRISEAGVIKEVETLPVGFTEVRLIGGLPTRVTQEKAAALDKFRELRGLPPAIPVVETRVEVIERPRVPVSPIIPEPLKVIPIIEPVTPPPPELVRRELTSEEEQAIRGLRTAGIEVQTAPKGSTFEFEGDVVSKQEAIRILKAQEERIRIGVLSIAPGEVFEADITRVKVRPVEPPEEAIPKALPRAAALALGAAEAAVKGFVEVPETLRLITRDMGIVTLRPPSEVEPSLELFPEFEPLVSPLDPTVPLTIPERIVGAVVQFGVSALIARETAKLISKTAAFFKPTKVEAATIVGVTREGVTPSVSVVRARAPLGPTIEARVISKAISLQDEAFTISAIEARPKPIIVAARTIFGAPIVEGVRPSVSLAIPTKGLPVLTRAITAQEGKFFATRGLGVTSKGFRSIIQEAGIMIREPRVFWGPSAELTVQAISGVVPPGVVEQVVTAAIGATSRELTTIITPTVIAAGVSRAVAEPVTTPELVTVSPTIRREAEKVGVKEVIITAPTRPVEVVDETTALKEADVTIIKPSVVPGVTPIKVGVPRITPRVAVAPRVIPLVAEDIALRQATELQPATGELSLTTPLSASPQLVQTSPALAALAPPVTPIVAPKPIGFLPTFPFKEPRRIRRVPRRELRPFFRTTRFTPSFAAVALGIRGPRPTGIFEQTFGIRPIPDKKKKRRREPSILAPTLKL